MENRIVYAVRPDILIDDEPELVIIRDHILEYYPTSRIYIFPHRDCTGKVTANFYLGCKNLVNTSALGHAYIRRIRCKKELINKLALIGIGVI